MTLLTLSACQTNDAIDLPAAEKAQGSEANIASLSAVVDRNPNDAEAYNVRGTAYGRAGMLSQALRDFNRAIALNRRFHQAFANRALIFRRMGQTNQAARDYNTALSINPQYDIAYIGRGNIYRQAGKTNQAFRDYNQAIQLDTTDPRAYHNRGLIYQDQRNHEFAIEDFSTAVSLADKAPAPYNARGVSYLAVDAEQNAFDDFNTALKLNSGYAEAWANQALVLERRGDKKRAFKSLCPSQCAQTGLRPGTRRYEPHARRLIRQLDRPQNHLSKATATAVNITNTIVPPTKPPPAKNPTANAIINARQPAVLHLNSLRKLA